jgi:predicted CoA-substrate-specific enzyme activase
MITGGIDVGIEAVKAVVLKDGKVVGRAAAPSGGARRGEHAEQTWTAALQNAGLRAEDVSQVVATGQGKYDAKFARRNVSEPIADAVAARFLYPASRMVVDAGADQVRVVSFDGKGKISEVALNQKCAAGLGIFLKAMARTLGLTLEEMGKMEDGSGQVVSDSCAVFGELDAIALIHRNIPVRQIVQALHNTVAVRINAIMNDKTRPDKSTTVLVGGLTLDAALVQALRRRSGIALLIPAEAQFAGALGAALIAAGQGG